MVAGMGPRLRGGPIPVTTSGGAVLVITTPRGAIAWCTFVVGVPDILAPLRDVPVHVVRTPRVRQELPDRTGRLLGALIEPRVLGEVLLGVAKAVVAEGSGPAGVLPLGFRGPAG